MISHIIDSSTSPASARDLGTDQLHRRRDDEHHAQEPGARRQRQQPDPRRAGFASTTISPITPGGTGNNNNAVIGCEIKRTQYGVFSSGLNATTKNTGTTVSQNKIDATGPDAVGKGGIYLRFEDNVTLAGNRIGNITSTSASPVFGISLD